jgi:LemA protein
MTAGIVLVALVLVVLVAAYNLLVRTRIRVRQAWAQVAVQLQRRHDLIPNLVAVVRGYAGHERAVFEEVTARRAEALAAHAPDRPAAEDALSAALGRLLVLAEGYPQLQADGTFQQLQAQLRETEDRISFARDFANSRVATYRKRTQTFPLNLVAGLFRFGPEELFALDDSRAAAAPEVDLPPAPRQ